MGVLMKKKLVKLLVVLSSTLMLTGVLAGCGSASTGNQVEEVVVSQVPSTESGTTVMNHKNDDFFGTFGGVAFSDCVTPDDVIITDAGTRNCSFDFKDGILESYMLTSLDSETKINWRGCTWGCNPEDVQNVYGEPLYFQQDARAGWAIYVFLADDGSGRGLRFRFEELDGGGPNLQLMGVVMLSKEEVDGRYRYMNN